MKKLLLFAFISALISNSCEASDYCTNNQFLNSELNPKTVRVLANAHSKLFSGSELPVNPSEQNNYVGAALQYSSEASSLLAKNALLGAGLGIAGALLLLHLNHVTKKDTTSKLKRGLVVTETILGIGCSLLGALYCVKSLIMSMELSDHQRRVLSTFNLTNNAREVLTPLS
jgi:hypothetical protein